MNTGINENPQAAKLTLELPKASGRQRLERLGISIVVLAAFIWAAKGAELYKFAELVTSWANMVDYGAGFLHPDFIDWKDFVAQMVVTLHMALWGTGLALIGAIPCGLLCSANITSPALYVPLRRVMDALRSINELIFAMLFVSAVGLGPFAGVLALFLHTLGVLAKLFSEAVEAIAPGPVEGIRATGASRVAEIVFGVLPQVLPLWISYTLYRFESNVRSATVVGMIGAGGIGFLLLDAIRSFEYGRTAAIMLIVVGVVVMLDIVSSRMRHALI